jgi:hypothetical protein
MKPFPTRVLICAAVASLAAGTAYAGGRANHSGSPGFAARPARSSAPARFSSAGVRQWNAGAGNFRGINNFNRNGVRWNSGAYRTGNIIRNGNTRWNGNRNGQFAFNRNGNWRHHHRGNNIVFIGGYGYYPWDFYYPYSYYGSYYPSYPYAYGDYQGSYGYDSGNGYDQPVYNGNDVDQNYTPGDDKGSYYQNSSSNASVAQVQRLLARAGYYKGAIDGAMGSRTYYAIRAYQRSHNLQVDGQIGPQLLSSLGRS